jgi:Flp pilus assembly pilin Flp
VISKKNRGSFSALFSRMICDESGAEVVEMVLVTALIALICLAAMRIAGISITQRWNDIVDMIPGSDNA